MTIDEAIKHCEEVADSMKKEATRYIDSDGLENDQRDKYIECASDHRQLAAWLRELQELRLTVGAIKIEDLKAALTVLREYKAENNEMREQIERLDSENFKLTEKLEEIGTAYNEQVSLVGWHEEREKEYKRLLLLACADIHFIAETFNTDCGSMACSECPFTADECTQWVHEKEALDLIGTDKEESNNE